MRGARKGFRVTAQIWNVVLGGTTLVAFALAIWQTVRAEQLDRRQRDLDWPRFRSTVADLAKSVDRSGFVPDFILALSDRGAIVAHLVARELRKQVPIIVLGYLDGPESKLDLPGHKKLTRSKNVFYLPEALRETKTLKVLLVDDFVMSGDGMACIKEELLAIGYPPEHLVSGAVVATRIAIANKKGPDHYGRETRDFDFYFPWGRAQ
jgi:hypoxanthine phosphoribosyltransferase